MQGASTFTIDQRSLSRLSETRGLCFFLPLSLVSTVRFTRSWACVHPSTPFAVYLPTVTVLEHYELTPRHFTYTATDGRTNQDRCRQARSELDFQPTAPGLTSTVRDVYSELVPCEGAGKVVAIATLC